MYEVSRLGFQAARFEIQLGAIGHMEPAIEQEDHSPSIYEAAGNCDQW